MKSRLESVQVQPEFKAISLWLEDFTILILSEKAKIVEHMSSKDKMSPYFAP